MSKSIPQVQKYMTAMPHTIGADQPLSAARKTLNKLGVRHLPVLDGGRITGLLSDRDINLLATFGGVDLNKALVSDAMVEDPFIVTPATPLTDVVAEMAEKKLGSALIVQQNGTLVGIFTYVDALRTLAEVFETRLKK